MSTGKKLSLPTRPATATEEAPKRKLAPGGTRAKTLQQRQIATGTPPVKQAPEKPAPRRVSRNATAEDRRAAPERSADEARPSRRTAATAQPRGPQRPAPRRFSRDAEDGGRTSPHRSADDTRRTATDQDARPARPVRGPKPDAGFAKRPAGSPARRDNASDNRARPTPDRGGDDRPRARPAARAPVDPDAPLRLSKRMTELGLCSRREADEYIERGLVRVDGVVVSELGSKVLPTQKIELDRAAQAMQAQRVTILLNKPVGYVSGQAEDGYENAAVLVTPENQWEDGSSPRRLYGPLRGLAPAGRLDIDSTGLLVLTQDGRIAKRLIGDDSEVEKEYLVRVEGDLSAEGMRLLNHGLELDGVKLRPAKVSWQNEDQLRFVLREGRKRQIRRMCELVGLTVVGLKRVRIGSVKLGPLPLGKWRYLRGDEKF